MWIGTKEVAFILANVTGEPRFPTHPLPTGRPTPAAPRDRQWRSK